MWLTRKSPWFSAITAIVGALFGIIGSIYSIEIKKTFEYYLPVIHSNSPPYLLPTGVFLVLLIVFTIMLKRSIDGQNEASKKVLDDSAEKLESMLRTLPDEAFLLDYVSYYDVAFKDFKEVLKPESDNTESDSAESHSDMIRIAMATCLNAIGQLARLFNGKGGHVAYRINLMEFKPIPSENTEKHKILERLKFIESNADLEKLEGILDARCDLALIMEDNGSPKPDTYARPFALPIPLTEKRVDQDGRPTVLPGPTDTFCYPEQVEKFILSDTQKIGQWLRENSGFRPEIAESVENYFSSLPGKLIRSTLSLPIGENDNGSIESNEQPLGVVNVHSNEINILTDKGAELFIPLTVPFRIILAVLLKINASNLEKDGMINGNQNQAG